MKRFKLKILNALYALAALAIIIIVWLIAYNCVKNDLVVPSIGDSLIALADCLKSGEFWAAFGYSFLRTLYSFAISFILAAAATVLSAVCAPFKRVFAVIISVVRTLPTMAVTLALLIWTTPRLAPVIVCILVLFPMIYSQFAAAVDGVDAGLLQMAKVYCLTRRQKLTKIILPQIAPPVLSEVGANLSFGIKLMVSAEVLSYTAQSLGGLMQQARLFSEIPKFAALTLTCIVLGLIIEWLASYLNLITRKWRIKEGGREN